VKKSFVYLLMLSFFLTFCAPGQVMAAGDFPDISQHWGKDYISTLASAGYINGYPDGTFKPDKTVSQAEFISVLINCMGVTPTDTTTQYFNDTSKHWALGSINEAVKRGILIPSEYSNVLRPDSGLKRSQAAAMMVRALGKQENNGTIPFTDQTDVQKSMYRGYIKTAFDLNLLTGYPGGEFKPFEYITRAQMCKVILNFMEINGGSQTLTPVTPVTPVSPVGGSFRYIAVGDELYELAYTPINIKIGFTGIAVNSLSASQNSLYVNNSYSFALNTSLRDLDIIVHNKRYQVDKIIVNGDKLVIFPTGQKFARLTIGNLTYDSDYIKTYINSANSKNYLSDLLLLDQYSVQLDGRIYDLGRDKVTIEVGNKFYDINRVIFSSTDNTPQLVETDSVIASALTISDISSIFVDNKTLNMSGVRAIDFIIDGKRYRLSEITIDAAGSFTVNNKNYPCTDVLMIVDGEQYEINHLQLYKEKFIFYCTYSISSNWVMINDVYRDTSEVKILKDNIVYDMEQVMVVSRNLLRIGGKQYDLDSTFKCRYDNKIYNIDKIDFNANLQAVVINTSESTGTWSSQPVKYVFYVNNARYLEGATTGVTIYANRRWVSFDKIVITDPAHFTYSGSTYNLIGAIISINNKDFEVTDTSWRSTQSFEIYMRQI
jgi:hypothetical protein